MNLKYYCGSYGFRINEQGSEKKNVIKSEINK